MQELDILILGAGWTATFLIPLLREKKLLFAATTTDGRDVAGAKTLKWRFDPAATDPSSAFAALPQARHILITFPLKGKGPSEFLVKTYAATHRRGGHEQDATGGFRFTQLGSTGIWQSDPAQTPWMDRHSPYADGDARAVAEDELRSLGGCVLNLAGLWGGPRDPRHWVDRVATTKEAVRSKTSLHMVHGVDVARLIVALVRKTEQSRWEGMGKGQRWMVTDGFVYDWWSLFAGWAEGQKGSDAGVGGGGTMDAKPINQARWVYELMAETSVRALPRSMEALGRCYDSRELWKTFELAPLKGGLGL